MHSSIQRLILASGAITGLSFHTVEAATTVTVGSQAVTTDPLARQFNVQSTPSAPFRLVCDEQGGKQEKHVVTRSAGNNVVVILRGLKAATPYACYAELTDGSAVKSASITFTAGALPTDLYLPKVVAGSDRLTQTGYTLYNYGYSGGVRKSSNYLVMLDPEGNVRWYYKGPTKDGVGGGDVDLTWLGNDKFLYGGEVSNHYPPTIIGLDKNTQFKGKSATMSPTDLPSNYTHDVGISEDGKSVYYINDSNIAGISPNQPSGVTYVSGFLLKKLDIASNTVTWAWDSINDGYYTGELPDPMAPYSSQDELKNDPYHANSVTDQLEADGRYIYVGMRNQNAVLKIKEDTRAVKWRLGVDSDFTLLEADGTPATNRARWFFNQHDAKAVGTSVLMYDNGYDRDQYGGTAYSRALRLELDETHMTARIAFEYTEPGWLEGIFGGFDWLPDGNYLLAIGHTSYQGSTGHNSSLVILSPAGKVLWRADFQTPQENIYRADHVDGCAVFANTRYCSP